MTAARRQLGRFGEQLAATHLGRLGYAIVERNWRCPIGEIDIVARDEDALVFVEVRSRRSSVALAAESVGPAKRRKLAELAQTYIMLHDLPEQTPWRIDVVAVALWRDGQVDIDHIANAVEE